MFDFCTKTRRQRINQRNRTERLSDVLDWSRMGLEYVKARWIAVRRKWPALVSSTEEAEGSRDFGYESDYAGPREDLTSLKLTQKVPRPPSMPGSPKLDKGKIDANAHLFDDSERATVNVDVLMDELRLLGLKGTSETYVPPSST